MKLLLSVVILGIVLGSIVSATNSRIDVNNKKREHPRKVNNPNYSDSFYNFYAYQDVSCSQLGGFGYGILLDQCSIEPNTLWFVVGGLTSPNTVTINRFNNTKGLLDPTCTPHNAFDHIPYTINTCNGEGTYFAASYYLEKGQPQFKPKTILYNFWDPACQNIVNYVSITNGSSIEYPITNPSITNKYYCDSNNEPQVLRCDSAGECQVHPLAIQCSSDNNSFSVVCSN
eukprot:gene9671-11856_t